MDVIRADAPSFHINWLDLVNSDGVHHDALYGVNNLEFYKKYSGANAAIDCSFVLLDKGVTVAGMRAIHYRRQDGECELSCFGLPILYLERFGIAQQHTSAIHKLVKADLFKIAYGSDLLQTISYREQLLGGFLSPPGKVLLNFGADAMPGFTQVIDLARTETEIHKEMTKACKWGVNWGRKNLKLSVIDYKNINDDSFDAFIRLHIEAAGRETRSRETWEAQKNIVLAREGFCIFGWLQGELVTAALFVHSTSHCYYGVSASRRALFDKPLSHALIWTALVHAKQMGINCFELGDQYFPSVLGRKSSQKELGISSFKKSFGGATRSYLDIRWNYCRSTELTES